MNRMKALAISTCLGLLAVAFLPNSKADEWDKKTILTVNAPLAIPGKVLEPGKYVMKLLNSQADRHIVQVFNEDESQIQATILAIPNYRLEPTGDTQFGFWEMPAGQPRALKAWFYPGDNFGQEFAYPKDMATTIARANNENVPTGSAESKGPIEETTPSGESQAMTMQGAPASSEHQTTEQQSASMAQTAESNNPAETQDAQSPAPAPATPQTDQNAAANQSSMTADQNASAPAQTASSSQLPRTASPFPLVGLAGLLSAGAAFLSRAAAKRSA